MPCDPTPAPRAAIPPANAAAGWRRTVPRAALCGLAALLTVACGQERPPDTQAAGTAPVSAPREEVPARLVRTQGPYEAEVSVQQNGGALSLRISPADAAAALPMTQRLELWRPLVEQALRDSGRRGEVRLMLGDYPELGPRVALAAACSGKWDPVTGRPTSGRVNTALLALMADTSLFAELSQFAGSLGYRASVASADAPVLCTWESVQPVAADRCRPALEASASVPCGATVVFQLRRLN